MHWAAPSPYGAPHAYTSAWHPSVRPPTDAPGFLVPRQPTHAYHAAPTYVPPTYAPSPPYPDAGYYMPSPALMPTPSYQPALLSAPTSTEAPSWDQAAFLQAM